MSYADDSNITTLTNALTDSVSSDLLDLSLTISDNWIDARIGGLDENNPPLLIAQAAEFYAVSFILHNLYDTSNGESPTALWYEKQATEAINAYTAQNSNEDDLTHPYSSSKTPSRIYTNRNKRTTYDYIDYDNQDDTQWPVED